MAAIEATTVRAQTMADGTLRLTIDVQPADAQAAFRMFGSPGTGMAAARLKTPKEALAGEDKTDKPKGGAAAKWLGRMCAEEDFQSWVCDAFNDLLESIPSTRPQLSMEDKTAHEIGRAHV